MELVLVLAFWAWLAWLVFRDRARQSSVLDTYLDPPPPTWVCPMPAADDEAACTVGELVAEIRDDRDAARRFALAAADRIHAAHEVLGRLAERRVVVISERDSCPLV